MTLDPDTCHGALRARDARFDGLFFVGVTTTGIYCRPICPARTPGRDRCRFFASAALAEKDGFRACFRCRPELAPGRGPVDAVAVLARQAAARIDAGYLNDHSVDQLADRLGVTARHLRRALEAELGVTPIELAQTRRLALAKQLLHDSRLGLTEIAFAAGFASVRRFNAAFRERFGRAPGALRRTLDHAAPVGDDAIRVRLDVRPPFDGGALLEFLAGRAIPGVEQVEAGAYRRSVIVDGHAGWLVARLEPRRAAVELIVSASLSPRLMAVVARVRALFDADAHPAVIAERLGADPTLAAAIAARPGLRVPGGFDGFELAVRAILGQQVSVAAATTLSGRLVDRLGSANPGAPPGVDRHFPTAARLADAGPAAIAAIGLPAARAGSIARLAEEVAAGRLDVGPGAAPEATITALEALPGIGPWTAHYLAMRALRWPDAFPAGDLIVRRALGVATSRAADERAAPWRPWRAYAAMHLWKAHAAASGERSEPTPHRRSGPASGPEPIDRTKAANRFAAGG